MTQAQPLTDDQKYSIAKEGKDLAIAKFSTHSYKVEKVPAFIAGYIAAGEKFAYLCIQKDAEIGELKSKLWGEKPLSQYVSEYNEAHKYQEWLGGETKWDAEKIKSMGIHEQMEALQGYQKILRDLDAMFYAVEEGVSTHNPRYTLYWISKYGRGDKK